MINSRTSMELIYRKRSVIFVTVFIVSQIVSISPLSSDVLGQESCFCKLQGEIDDCSCRIENVDLFNNQKVYSRLNRLLERDYFRYYKVNMLRPCTFKNCNIGQCGLRSCAVDECHEDQLPAGLKSNSKQLEKNKEQYMKENQLDSDSKLCQQEVENSKLGDLDVTLSKADQEAFEEWKNHDDQLNNFCETDDIEPTEAVYYDLILNPERYTGYAGPSANNLWQLIYDQNCFKSESSGYGYPLFGQGLCLEGRTFYRLISGFHTSVSVHIAANYLIPGRNVFEAPRWGPSVDVFLKRFDPVLTRGEGPNRLRNLYFAYLIQLRALAKVAPYLAEESFYTGNEAEDNEIKQMVMDLLEILKSFPNHYDESTLFQGDQQSLMEEFKIHFRNITRIMDCVGCDKCRLWGKVQITGMGTALKILFSGDSMLPDSTVTRQHTHSNKPFQLVRGEIVALFNSFGRLSKSIHEIEMFRRMLNSS